MYCLHVAWISHHKFEEEWIYFRTFCLWSEILLPAIYCRMGILGRRADAAWIDDELVENGSKKKVVWITCDSFRWQTEGQRGVWDEVAKVTTSCRSMWRFLSF